MMMMMMMTKGQDVAQEGNSKKIIKSKRTIATDDTRRELCILSINNEDEYNNFRKIRDLEIKQLIIVGN